MRLTSSDNTAPISNKTLNLLNNNNRVHQLGFQEDIRPSLLAADVLVLPSYREGFPNIVLQAGAMGLPVIATDINGSNEIIIPDLNGWLVEPKNTDSLTKTMLHTLKIPKVELKEMGTSARLRIQQKFEQADHWDRLVKFYKEKLDHD